MRPVRGRPADARLIAETARMRPDLALPALERAFDYSTRSALILVRAYPGPIAIPRISHNQRHTAASKWHLAACPDMQQGRQSVHELLIHLVAGVGFEPT